MAVRGKALAPTVALSVLVLVWIFFLHSSILQNSVRKGVKSTVRSADLHFFPIKNGSNYVFMSEIRDTDRTGVPEFFYFNTSSSVLCLRGNSTRNGSDNYYALASASIVHEQIPHDALLLPGTTLISDSHFDFVNPWHAMYNLIQFVHWRTHSGCEGGDRMLVFHHGEFRRSLGAWIQSVLDANGVATAVDTLKEVERDKVVCFERAVVSRRGIGGVTRDVLRDTFGQARCKARQWCGIRTRDCDAVETPVTVRIGLVVREGGRGFINSSDWKYAIEDVCRMHGKCNLSVIQFSQLDFCGQVEVMSRTDVLVSVHGAQLTNMMFMSPGSRIFEAFPKGWLEFAGHGQFIYKHLANWVGLRHEGYWRDDEGGTECPADMSPGRCFGLLYKNKPVGINSTFVVERLTAVVTNFSETSSLPSDCHLQ